MGKFLAFLPTFDAYVCHISSSILSMGYLCCVFKTPPPIYTVVCFLAPEILVAILFRMCGLGFCYRICGVVLTVFIIASVGRGTTLIHTPPYTPTFGHTPQVKQIMTFGTHIYIVIEITY